MLGQIAIIAQALLGVLTILDTAAHEPQGEQAESAIIALGGLDRSFRRLYG